ncbi:hypothetical protein H6P81_004310 [Aristolochia fimbriata]|uniref:Glutaredoxin domain-containing protein n=1 Tax=Aristolochia fimbriata TaxID=158543 RepID=A0AAV7FF21_ARIFI|nr:hypothetical protein H6P81_004310 [Aristolochia fimbriata]
METMQRLASQNAVVIFSRSSCCMCHTTKTLFVELGVTPAVYELDRHPRGAELEAALARLVGRRPSTATVPVVFIGGELKGSTREIMALHLRGDLVPLLRKEGAIFGTF